ncbi:MAG: hypothetical protein R3F59_04090 [Myxococcota bacterium]
MHRAVIPLSLLCAALPACAPENAKLTEGKYIAFLSEGTALSLSKGTVNPNKYDVHYDLDCRNFATQSDEDALRLDNAIDICDNEDWPPQYEEWATQAGFRVVTEKLDPWRGEALITSEGDLQIAFHHHVPGGGDMRFVIAIDPDFGPTTCVQDPNGGVKRVPLDGDWIGEWSKELDWIRSLPEDQQRGYEPLLGPELDGGRLWFLNAYGYQLNPVDVDGQLWDLPPQWVSGAAQGRFVEENLFHRTPRFGEPYVYNLLEVEGSTGSGTLFVDVDPTDLWYCDMEEGADPHTAPCAEARPNMDALDARVREVADGVRLEIEEMTRVSKETVDGEQIYVADPEADPLFSFAPIPHTNYWRIPDGRPPGLDGWAELHYNYIAFSKDSLLEEGGSARGAFALTMDASSSSSRVFIQGKFGSRRSSATSSPRPSSRRTSRSRPGSSCATRRRSRKRTPARRPRTRDATRHPRQRMLGIASRDARRRSPTRQAECLPDRGAAKPDPRSGGAFGGCCGDHVDGWLVES